MSSSTAFAAQTQHYQEFKVSMTRAYQIALDLCISFAKCSDLVYDFQFPRIHDKFDPFCMEARASSGSMEDGVLAPADDRHIAVGLLPSIWSRKRTESDTDKAGALVTKAVVLL